MSSVISFRHGASRRTHQLPRCRRRVDRGVLPGEHLQPDAAGGEVVDGVDEVVQVPAEPVELPHYEDVTVPERLQA